MPSANASTSASRPARIEYSERRLVSLNGYAMAAIAVVLAAVAVARFTDLRDT